MVIAVLWHRGDAFAFSYLCSITECAADNRSATLPRGKSQNLDGAGWLKEFNGWRVRPDQLDATGTCQGGKSEEMQR